MSECRARFGVAWISSQTLGVTDMGHKLCMFSTKVIIFHDDDEHHEEHIAKMCSS